ncbi:MAG TPA: tetratricopeptide repeat-containing glycosyltransferase family protein [Pirellulales bacterium]|nr:tetratricopeptide repeat-containing glycosyltransferase family protein [Pirellulales bacterium]
MNTIPEALELAEIASRAGDFARAQFIYEQILKVSPEPQALNGMGLVAIHAGRLDVAEDYLRRAIAAQPRNAAFQNNLSELYRQQGRLDLAEACCRQALEVWPSAAQLHNNLGIILKEQKRFDESVASLTRAIELDPRPGYTHYNLANTYTEMRALDLAEGSYRRALTMEPDSYDIHNNFANVLDLQGQWSEALAELNASLRLKPDYAQAHRNHALHSLRLGNFAEGWPEYEWRWHVPGEDRPTYSQPRWQGQPLDGRTILLCWEQGLGDTLQFIRYAPLVKSRGGHVVVQCQSTLVPLLRNMPGIDGFAPAHTAGHDYYCPLMSLPAVFDTRLETIPRNVPYLFAEQERALRWRQQLGGERKLKVGIAWQGSRGFRGDYYRSIPLAQLAPLARLANVQLFSLQRGFGREQVGTFAESWPLVEFDDSFDADGAFVDTAAVMMNLDVVITSDTAIAHLAGGLGVNVWVALQYSPNWRWLLKRADSPWYPSMRLFRQARWGDWTELFERIAGELASISAARGLS